MFQTTPVLFVKGCVGQEGGSGGGNVDAVLKNFNELMSGLDRVYRRST